MWKVGVMVALGLAACVPLRNESPEPMPPMAACPASELQHLIGQPATAQDFQAMEGPVRILPPGSMMTMDHNPSRLNVDLDAAGSVTRLWCG